MGKGKRKRLGKAMNDRKARQNNASLETFSEKVSKDHFFGIPLKVMICAFLGFVTILIYSNTLNSPFIFDDINTILTNRHIRVTELTWGKIIDCAIGGPGILRPVANISLGLNYYFGQYNLMGYHMVNIAVHIISGILIFFFVQTTLKVYSNRYRCISTGKLSEPPTSEFVNYSAVAFFSSLLWLVNPLHTNSVTYIVQRMNSMAAMFYILSMLFYAKGRIIQIQRSGSLIHDSNNQQPDQQSKIKNPKFKIRLHHLWFAGCVISGLFGMGCKEITATLPFFIILYELYFFRDLGTGRSKRFFQWLIGTALFLVIIVTIYLCIDPSLIKKLFFYMDDSLKEFTVGQRVLTEFRVVVYYISLFLFPLPSRLNLIHDFPVSHSLIDPVTTLFSLCLITAIIGFAVYIARKQQIVSFCILWFFGNLIIESSVIPLELVYEHRTYLPSMLFPLLIVLFLYKYIKKRWLINAILCLAVLLGGVWTYERNKVWKDDVTFWRDCVKKSPQKARAHFNLGIVLLRQGNISEAVSHYSEALRINPDSDETHDNLAVALMNAGKADEALRHLYEALRINPNNATAQNNLGFVLLNYGKIDEAVSHFFEALRIDPENALAHTNLGFVYLKQGKIDKAIEQLSEAVRIDPGLDKARNNLRAALMMQRKVVEEQ